MYKQKSVGTGVLLALFLGGIGAHHFYVGKYIRGTLYLLFCWTYIPIFLGFIDIFFIRRWVEQSNAAALLVKMEEIRMIEENPRETFEPVSVSTIPFYNETDLILPEFQYLKTPTHILEEIECIRQPVHRNRSGIYIEVSTYHSEFVKQSLAYSRRVGKKCSHIPLKAYYTTFQHLDERQKEWYFYWRSQVLQGNYPNTDLSYIFLFVYELINYSFNQNAAFNISMLMRLYKNYKERHPNLEHYLLRWKEDFLHEIYA
ncbi:TerB N-terminal domain-containing protein [Aneurinibacillus danicus]|uniref:TM2 domain-containing protein n=1 Tax=Aneurinibacillus danicus TaxID=267746 RepID=A0A511V4G3_9BACL|nr:hypothetical protein ADA01nite_04310 [Aneurinibacillus danicus]